MTLDHSFIMELRQMHNIIFCCNKFDVQVQVNQENYSQALVYSQLVAVKFVAWNVFSSLGVA